MYDCKTMPKQKQIVDPVFGPLDHVVSDLWKRKLQLNFLGRKSTVSLTIDISPKRGIEPNQISAFQVFTGHQKEILHEAETAIFDYYASVCEDYRAQRGVTNPRDKMIPIPKNRPTVFKLITPVGVTFPYVCAVPTFGILCDCTWEEEHGLAVKYEGRKLVEVGFQDIVL